MGLDSTYPELTTLKVVYNGLARRVKVPYDMEWNDFEHKVCRLFNISPPLVTSYKDSMGVSVIVDNGDDFFFFLDEEYTGRLDIVTNVEASEASDWTVVRTDTGKALKELDRSSEISLSDNASEKSKPESGNAHPDSASSTFSSRARSLGPEKIPSITSGSPVRAMTPEVPQVAIQPEATSTSAENFHSAKESSSSSPTTEDVHLVTCSESASTSKLIPDLRFFKLSSKYQRSAFRCRNTPK
ncbi:hypothetical protein DSO57_1028160 [Entomophthora muscae]|uniref:Uncharacterized protein n=1 Tax=Entomophthora muscae TaxID=34485 RepID=A0ACC2SQP9_9FUNG|nr:hypothetical protein DSO57_1028160 [Entomophthora muscae]